MRRRSRCVLTALLALLLLALPTAAFAEVDVPDGAVLAGDVVVLAAADGEGEDLGPDPMPRNAEDNPARTVGGYEDQERPFTWYAAWLLLFLALVGIAGFTAVYVLRVRQPAQQARR